MCAGSLLIAAAVLAFFGIKLLRENSQTDNPEKKVNPAIPVGMLIVAAILAAIAIRTFYVISQLP